MPEAAAPATPGPATPAPSAAPGARPVRTDEGSQALLRRLEWTVLRRLDGLVQGDWRTLRRGHGVDLAAMEALPLGGMERLAAIESAINALIGPDTLRREFFGMCRKGKGEDSNQRERPDYAMSVHGSSLKSGTQG